MSWSMSFKRVTSSADPPFEGASAAMGYELDAMIGLTTGKDQGHSGRHTTNYHMTCM